MTIRTLVIAVFILAASAVRVGFCFHLGVVGFDENVWELVGAEYEIG
jgi:hypothetical protein